jgi:hypothetical protein
MARNPRSYKVKPDRVQEVRMKFRERFNNDRDELAEKSKKSKDTVRKYLNGDPVDEDSCYQIGKCLSLSFDEYHMPNKKDEATPAVPETAANYAEDNGQAQGVYAEYQPIESGFSGEHQSAGPLMCIETPHATDTEEKDPQAEVKEEEIPKAEKEVPAPGTRKQAQTSGAANVNPSGDRTVAVGGNVSGNIVTGDGNIVR